jgi:hypothetical protein
MILAFVFGCIAVFSMTSLATFSAALFSAARFSTAPFSVSVFAGFSITRPSNAAASFSFPSSRFLRSSVVFAVALLLRIALIKSGLAASSAIRA